MNIKERRIELYGTQKKLAEALGFSVGAVSAAENHYTLFGNMSKESRQKWAKTLKCTEKDLLKSDASTMKTESMVPCKTYHMDKEKLELYLKARWGDKIGKVRHKETSLLSAEWQQYERENRWVNLIDTRMNKWGYEK